MSTNDPAYVAEQTGQVIGVTVTDQPLEPLLADARPAVTTRAMGAYVTFEGIVRDHDGGERVAALSYEAHPTAENEMRRVAEDIAREYPVRVWAAHRTGPVPIGAVAFAVAVAGAHRQESFAACSLLADRVKAEVPIWKEQELSGGGTQWVGLE